MSEEWKWVYVRRSQYCLQTVKYKKHRKFLTIPIKLAVFLPPLIPVMQTAEGLDYAQNDARGTSYLNL